MALIIPAGCSQDQTAGVEGLAPLILSVNILHAMGLFRSQYGKHVRY